MQFKKNKNKKLSKSCFNKDSQQDHKHKHDSTFIEQNFKKRHSFIFQEKQEKRHKKNFYFAYDKSDHQVRDYCFKKKMTSNKSSAFEFMQLDINKLTSDLYQVKIYTDLKIKISSRFQIIQVLMNSEVFVNYMSQIFLIKNR